MNQDNDPISVVSAIINNNAQQRSMVKGVTASFGQVLNFGSAAFEIRRSDGYTPTLNVTPVVVGNQSVVALTFSGPGIVGGSLPDGNYTLTIAADQVTDSFGQQLDGDNNGLRAAITLWPFTATSATRTAIVASTSLISASSLPPTTRRPRKSVTWPTWTSMETDASTSPTSGNSAFGTLRRCRRSTAESQGRTCCNTGPCRRDGEVRAKTDAGH